MFHEKLESIQTEQMRGLMWDVSCPGFIPSSQPHFKNRELGLDAKVPILLLP